MHTSQTKKNFVLRHIHDGCAKVYNLETLLIMYMFSSSQAISLLGIRKRHVPKLPSNIRGDPVQDDNEPPDY